MGLSPGEMCPIDECDQEVEMIVPALRSCKDERVLAEKMANIFKLQFDEDFSSEIFDACSKNILKKTKNLLK